MEIEIYKLVAASALAKFREKKIHKWVSVIIKKI